MHTSAVSSSSCRSWKYKHYFVHYMPDTFRLWCITHAYALNYWASAFKGMKIVVCLFVTILCLDKLHARELSHSPLSGHCCNSGGFHGASLRCFPYTTACQLTQPVVGYIAPDMALELGWSHYCWMQTLLDALGALTSRWYFPTSRPWPHKIYKKIVIAVT